MPITFKSKHAPDIVMLESVALQLIKMMGHSGSVPSSIAADDIPSALSELRERLSRVAPTTSDDDDESRIGLDKRAGPLLDMLESAAANADYIIWDR